MRNTLIKNKGFTLIEMAISILVIGLVMAMGASYFSLITKNEKIIKTDKVMIISLNSLGGFKSVYGRYPCPAPLDATLGDTNYGREDCTLSAAGTCTNGICTDESIRVDGSLAIPLPANLYVLRGTLPFRTMNMTEDETYDGYGNRLTYAVTAVLTDDNTFQVTHGGLTIIDENDDDLVLPIDSAHFAIISHGSNGTGAYTRGGSQLAGCGSASLDQENCNAGTTFRASLKRADFDDEINFFTAITTQEWQRENGNNQNINLKDGTKIAIGATIANISGTSEAIEIFDATDQGILNVEGGIISSANICEYNGSNTAADCFPPELIGGTVAAGGGMDCGTGFLVGIENGAPICEAELFISCPDGEFIEAIESDGDIRCGTTPPLACPDASITTSCGPARTILGSFSGDTRVAYSGDCYEITDRNAAYFTSVIAPIAASAPNATSYENQVNAHIDTLNNETRTYLACGTTSTDSRIRDTFQCNSGTWSNVRSYEGVPNFNTSHWSGNNAEFSGPSYSRNGTQGWYHDCWCREDYRYQLGTCSGGLSGNTLSIQKFNCPSRSWTTLYTDNTTMCGCVAGTDTDPESCASYYGAGLTTFAISGDVVHTYAVTCVSGSPITAITPTSTDTSACNCPYRPILLNRTYCPVGTTNSFSWTDPDGTTYNETGVQSITYQDWVCGGSPSSGSYTTPISVPSIPTCGCDSSYTDDEDINCPSLPHITGTGAKYEKEWDCAESAWEAPEDWDLLSNQCFKCTVQTPSGAPTFSGSSSGPGDDIGNYCNCTDGTVPICNYQVGPGNYNVYSSCPCIQGSSSFMNSSIPWPPY